MYDGGPIVEYVTGNLGYFNCYSRLVKCIFGVQLLVGGNFAIKKEVFLENGGFDETIINILQVEDLVLSKKLCDSGYDIRWNDRLQVRSSLRRLKKSPKDTVLKLYNSVGVLMS